MLNYFIRKRILLSRIFVISMIAIIIISDQFRVNTLNISTIESLGLSVVGFVFVTLGGFGRLWASLYVEGFKTKTLITEGPYSMVRNPLYFFTHIILLGFCLVVKSIPIAITLIVAFTVLHIPAIIKEEKKLLAQHNSTYTEYYNSTPRLIPNVFKYKQTTSTDRIEVKIDKINQVIWEIIGYFMLYLAIDLYILI